MSTQPEPAQRDVTMDRLRQRIIRDLTSFLISARLEREYERARAHAEAFMLGVPDPLETWFAQATAAARAEIARQVRELTLGEEAIADAKNAWRQAGLAEGHWDIGYKQGWDDAIDEAASLVEREDAAPRQDEVVGPNRDGLARIIERALADWRREFDIGKEGHGRFIADRILEHVRALRYPVQQLPECKRTPPHDSLNRSFVATSALAMRSTTGKPCSTRLATTSTSMTVPAPFAITRATTFPPLPTPPQGRPMNEQRIRHRHSGWHEHTMADLGDATEPHTHALAAVPAHTPGALDRSEWHVSDEWCGYCAATHDEREADFMNGKKVRRLLSEAASPSEETR